MRAQRSMVIKKEEVKTNWWHVDAKDQIVGRLATQIAVVLMGKDKPTYTPNVDCGDYVVVTNCKDVVFTGRKLEQKFYRRHTGFVGGIKEVRADKLMETYPERVLFNAVKRMLPKGPLGNKYLKKLRVFPGSEHEHSAQNPVSRQLNKGKSV